MEIKEAVKKPIKIKFAHIKQEDDFEPIAEWAGGFVVETKGTKAIIIPTLEGDMKAELSDVVIEGIQGEYYPCKQDIFKGSYDVLD